MVWYNIKQVMPPADETVRVIGQQWAWSFQQAGPDGVLDTADDIRTVGELHVKVNTTYHFELMSRDVVHSFAVPAFRLKQDALPGRTITGWFRPNRVGTYDIQCTQMCGIGHALMAGRIIVETPQDHAAWLMQQFESVRRWAQAHAAHARYSLADGCDDGGDAAMSTRSSTRRAGIFQKYFWSTDHKMIAMQYLFTGMAMALIGGFFAYVFRMQLGFPNQHVPGYGIVTPGKYNALVTMHGSIMIFWVAMPVLIAAFGNFLIPLMVGCDDMAFPRINRLSYQIFLLSALVLLSSFLVKGGPFGGAWTAYPPLSAVGAYNLTPIGATLWLLAVALEFVAFLLGGINFTVTTMNSRAPGMKMYDIPLVVWMIVLASIIFMASAGPLIAGAVMLLFDQTMSTGFYDPTRGGDPLLWQHLFWFFGHPEVYVVLLPAMGIVAEVIAVFARKKDVRLQDGSVHDLGRRVPELRRVGAPSICGGHRSAHGQHFFRHDAADFRSHHGNGFPVHRHALRRIDPAGHAHAVGPGLYRGVHDRRRDGNFPGLVRHGHLSARHVFRHRAFPLHVRPHRDHRRICRHHVLVSENVRPHAQ